MMYYFASDGSYGVWDDSSTIIDTTGWTASDWEEIDSCLDSERAFVARGIGDKVA